MKLKSLKLFSVIMSAAILASCSGQNMTIPDISTDTSVQAQAATKAIVIDVSKLTDSKNPIATKKDKKSSSQKNKVNQVQNIFKFNLSLKNDLDPNTKVCYDAIISMTGQRSNEEAYRKGRAALDALVINGVYAAKLAAAAINNGFRSNSSTYYDGVKILLVTFTHLLAQKENNTTTTAELLRNIAFAPDKYVVAYLALYSALQNVSQTDNNEVRNFILYNLQRSEPYYNADQFDNAQSILLKAVEKLGRQDYTN